ncbi:MAG: DUF1638 domain-containing protein [Planctomycetota bacterium]|nr:DUF1638 domain-containing protein [Planctomycetota bacterium]
MSESPRAGKRQLRLKMICCEVLYREVCLCAARSPHVVDVKFLEFGLHDRGAAAMNEALRAEIEAVPPPEAKNGYDAVLLGYGLCSNGTAGLGSQRHTLVIPRAHDCITMLLGSKERYKAEFDAHPGTYYLSPGWIEHHNTLKDEREYIMNRLGLNPEYDELVAKFGEENARYVMETLGGWGGLKSYDRMVYIDTGLGPVEDLAEAARRRAAESGWGFAMLKGDIRLLEDLLAARWDPERFLVVPPGRKIRPSCDGSVIRTE